MGCNVREKHIRTNRRPRSVAKPDFSDQANSGDKGGSISNPGMESGLYPVNYQLGFSDSSSGVQNPNPNSSGLNPNFDDGGWGYCSEEQLEEIVLKNLEFLYNEAITKLVGLGYDEDVALRAVLRNGHCYGGNDVLTNIMHNTLSYLNSESGGSGSESDENEVSFTELRQLEEYSLAGMVCLLQQVRPQLSRGDAMWCLLMSDLHVNRASAIEVPAGLLSCNNRGSNDPASNNVESGANSSNVESGANSSNNSVGVTPALCRFHGGWGFGNGSASDFPANGLLYAPELSLQREIECPKRFNLSPSMKKLLRRNVALFAAGFRANARQLQIQSQVCSGPLCDKDSPNAVVTGGERSREHLENLKNQDVVNEMLSKFREMHLDGELELVPEDQKDEMILSLIHQIKDLENQVKERKEWAHQKAMQAARKLSNDLTELKTLRMEREETQRLKQGKPTPEDPTMKRLSEMESALRKASGQVDRANAAVRRLETENAEIRAEMEAQKLSASESVTACLEVAKREKKCLKRLLVWEKQRTKMQEEIAAEKQKFTEIQNEMVELEASKKDLEARWRQEQEAKGLAATKVEEERHRKEAAEANNKRRHESLRLKIEIDFQRHKDDIQRLEQELSRLKASAEANQQSPADSPGGADPQTETIARLLDELDNLEVSSGKEGSDRECLICMKDEVSVVFLPCAHQVLCANCNEEYGKKGRATCPCCRVPIEQRIRVFGASSS